MRLLEMEHEPRTSGCGCTTWVNVNSWVLYLVVCGKNIGGEIIVLEKDMLCTHYATHINFSFNLRIWYQYSMLLVVIFLYVEIDIETKLSGR